MISRKQWVALFIAYLLYLLVGGAIFLYLEADNEIQNERTHWQLQKKISSILLIIDDDNIREGLESAIQELGSHIGEELLADSAVRELDNGGGIIRGVGNISINASVVDEFIITDFFNSSNSQNSTMENFVAENMNFSSEQRNVVVTFPEDTYEDHLMWNLWNAFFFSFTAITTIGFGHMYPKTEYGQFFCIVYSLFGVPFNGIVFAGLADLFSSKLMYKVDSGRYVHKWKIVLDTCLYLVPGSAALMLVPALIMMYFEDWTFLESFYFAFITLSTIGFGDYVSGYPPSMTTPWVWVYRICIMVWICFGLGYLLMVIAFIQRALRSEGFRKLDRSVKKALKKQVDATASHIRGDLDKIRQILVTISKHRTISEIDNSSDIQERLSLTDESSKQMMTQRRKVTDVEILMELAETVISSQATASEDGSVSGPFQTSKSVSGQNWIDNPAFEEDVEKEESPAPMRMNFATRPLNALRRASIAMFPPPRPVREEEAEKSVDTLGDILNKVENMLQNENEFAADIVGEAVKRRASFYLPNEDSKDDDDVDPYELIGPERYRDIKRRYTLATLFDDR